MEVIDKKEILRLIDAYWKFDNNQQPMSSWHDKQDLLKAVEKEMGMGKRDQQTGNWKADKLLAGETFITSEKGNSMVPLIKSGQDHELSPATWEEVEVGDIVYCKVSGRYYTHLVKAKDPTRGCQIGNNRGNINGWTKNVYGKVTDRNPN